MPAQMACQKSVAVCLQAVCHDSPFVRTAAQAALSELPYPLYGALPSSWQAQICSWVWEACQHDSAAAVRAAAAKCLGRTAEGMPVQNCPSGLQGVRVQLLGC